MIETLIKATILLTIVSLAAHLLRKHSASLRHLLWTLAIVALIALPVLTVAIPFDLPILPAPIAASGQHTGTPSLTAENPAVSARESASETNGRVEAPFPGRATTSNTGAPARPVNWARIALATWLVVLCLMVARFLAGLVVVTRIARRALTITDESWHALADRASRSLGVTTPVDLRVSEEVAMPFACGLLTPVIVLPSSATAWSAERREAVLMHEFAHISRGDLAMNTLSQVVRAIYWFHPLAWLASHRLRVEGERACDDAVLRTGALPSDYAEHLLSIVRSVGKTVPSAALAMARRSDFEGRLLAILEPGVQRGRLGRLRAAGLAAIFLGAVMPLAAMTPARATASTPASPATQPVSPEPAAVSPESAPPSRSISTALRQAAPPQQTSAPATSQQPATAVTALIETLSDANPVVRLAAVSSLGSLGDPRAIAALAKALKEDTDPRVREAAANSLGEIDDNRAVPALLEALKTEKVAKVKERIVRALGEIDDNSAVAGIAAVVKDPSVNVRRAAVHALGELEDPSAMPALLQMVGDDDVEVRQQLASAFGNLEHRDAIGPLMTMARDPDAEVRQQALSSLSHFEEPRALPVFLTALKDANAEVRQEAAHGVSNLDLKSAPRQLLDAMSDTDREVREAVIDALGNIGDEAAVPGLKRLTSDTDTGVRRAAAEALSDIGGVEAIQALMGLLKDTDPEIRKVAAEALGKKRHE